MKPAKTVQVLCLVWLCSINPAIHANLDQSVQRVCPLDACERLLAAVGGRQLWATKRYVHTRAVNWHPDARLPYIQEAWIDLEQPAHRIQLNNFDMQRIRVYTPSLGWGVTESRQYDFDTQRLAAEHENWRRLIYRKLRLLATDNPNLLVTQNAGSILEFTHDNEYLGWIEVNENGAPAAHGLDQDRQMSTAFGDLVKFDRVAWVRSGQQSGGWAFETLYFELLDEDFSLQTAHPVTEEK